MIVDPSVVKIFGVNDDDVDWAAYGREAFLQNWRKRAEGADRAIAERDEKWEEVKALAEQVADTRRRAERAEAELERCRLNGGDRQHYQQKWKP